MGLVGAAVPIGRHRKRCRRMLCRPSYVRVLPSSPPGWIRTSDLRRRRTELCPLSYGRESPRQELNPHLGRTKGACLPLTLRGLDGDGGSRTRSSSVQARRSANRASSPSVRRGSWGNQGFPHAEATAFFLKNLIPSVMRTGGVEPPQSVTLRLQRSELAGAQRPRERAADRDRTGTAGITTPGAAGYTTAAMSIARVGFEPTISSS
jgi:hypothetical protein